MFTGLVEAVVPLSQRVPQRNGLRLSFDCGRVSALDRAERTRIGDSIALNGCCLTVVEMVGDLWSFEAGEETLSRTNLGRLDLGDPVNLERSLRLGDRLGGHCVTGHIDGQGTLVDRRDDGPWSYFRFSAHENILWQMASKGSIAIDGVSLTVVDVFPSTFSVALIPHTLSVTTLGQRQVGDLVNLETDLLAKYVQRQMLRQAGEKDLD